MTMPDRDPNAPPINPLPWVVWAIVLPMIGMEVAANLGERGILGGAAGIGWRAAWVQDLGFAPDYLRWMWETGQWPIDGLMRLVTYHLIHGAATHAVFVVVILLALGKFVGEVFRWWAVLVTFFGATAVGAVVYTLVPWSKAGLIGGYPGVYGLIGAYSFLLWTGLAGREGGRLRAFRLIGFLLALQLAFAVFGVVMYGAAQGTTWEFVADIGGFGAGFLLAFVVSPGGWARVLARLRAL
jgi:membrane associated rhomboid family serine protease